MIRTTSLVVIFCLLLSCKKYTSDFVKGSATGSEFLVVLDPGQSYSIDSACVMIPNVFTPNGDGMNDLFYVVTQNISSISMEIRRGSELVASVQSGPCLWDGSNTANLVREAGFYSYRVSFITTSGNSATLSGRTYLNPDPEKYCISTAYPPQTNDAMDPGNCAFSFVAAERFCLY